MKARVINRKQFLKGNIAGERAVRPPWSIEESHFTEVCTRCFKCAEACSSHLIVKGAGGFPEMSFLRQGCDYCQDCVQACTDNALLRLTKDNHQLPWHQRIVINDQCFATKGILCRSCGEVCEVDAIEFKLLVGGMSQISTDTTACNGCGECVHICPAQAIEIQKIDLEGLVDIDSARHIPVSENPGGETP